MKWSKNLLFQLKNLPYFDKNAVFQLAEPMKIGKSTIETYISRYIKHKEILKLKNGLYVSSDFFNANIQSASYSYFLANIIRAPSYVSSWSALQHYGLTTETINAITSVTPKTTRTFRIGRGGSFIYQSITPELFSGFSLVKGKFDFLIASPSKALFDLLYFRTRGLRNISHADAVRLIEELRIDFDELSGDEKKKFNELIKKYE